MTDDKTRYERLKADLQRPVGGWTFGLITWLAPMAIAVIGLLGYWPGPNWTAMLIVLTLVIIHIIWGAHGYYPRKI